MNVLTVSGTGSLVRAERPLPEPEASEVLVEVAYAGVNFADLGTKEGVPGSEVAGRIVACGDGVQALRVGDAVVGMRAVGGYAELARIPAAFATKLPPTVSLETAAAAYLQGLTAYHLLHTAGRLSPGERVLVLAGAGGVGGLALQWARLAQAHRPRARVGRDHRRLGPFDASGCAAQLPAWLPAALKASARHLRNSSGRSCRRSRGREGAPSFRRRGSQQCGNGGG